MAQNLTRNKNITFRVTDKEYEMVRRRMAQTNITNLRAYLLKMAIDGRVISFEPRELQECSRLLGNVANNVNQLARRANSGGNVYAADLTDVRERLGEVLTQQDKIIRLFADLVDAA